MQPASRARPPSQACGTVRAAGYAPRATRLGRPLLANDFEGGSGSQGFMAELLPQHRPACVKHGVRHPRPRRRVYIATRPAGIFAHDPRGLLRQEVLPAISGFGTRRGRLALPALRWRQHGLMPTIENRHVDLSTVACRSQSSRRHQRRPTSFVEAKGAGSIERYPTLARRPSRTVFRGFSSINKLASDRARRVGEFGAWAGHQPGEIASAWPSALRLTRSVTAIGPGVVHRVGQAAQLFGAVLVGDAPCGFLGWCRGAAPSRIAEYIRNQTEAASPARPEGRGIGARELT
jgi:hypothetical protein